MKKIIPFFVLIILSFCVKGQTEFNPFESIGKEGKMLTLSNGKYIEVEMYDSLQRIGSVIINRNTGEIHELLPIEDTSDFRYDPTTFSRWYSVDPMAAKYPSWSPYNFTSNNPILLIDPDGGEWVNSHEKRVQQLEQALLDNPSDKKIIKEINREKLKAEKLNNILKNLKENDISLYNYIDNLTVKDAKTGELINVKVSVSLAGMNEKDGTEDAKTTYGRSKSDKTKFYVEYKSKEDLQDILPGPINKNDEIGFDIILYSSAEYVDVFLSNEAGDVMYRMEYPAASLKSGSDKGKSSELYRKKGTAGDYSEKVELLYKERKKDGTGKDENNNPYPIEK